jgi:hypothetical protein
MWGRMGGGMMGGGGGYGTGASSFLWMVPVLLIAASAVAVIGVVFYSVFPELRYIRGSCDPQKTETVASPVKNTVPAADTVSPVVSSVSDVSDVSNVSNVSSVSSSCDVLLKTMTPEEQKVLNVLVTHNGKYLQKYVGKEAGLSRLKTHRIVARFAQRGIVTVTEFGNTNEILLSDWVKEQTMQKTE